MRILFATDAFPPGCGGSGWSAFYLARALVSRGHAVEVVQPKAGAVGIHTRVYENLAVTEFGYALGRAAGVPGLRAWQRAAALDKDLAGFLDERVRAGGVDLIHAQHLLTVPAAVKAGRAAPVPVVSTVRDYWPVCLYGTLWRDGGICPICHDGELVRCLEQKYGAASRFARPILPLVERELARRQRALRDSAAVIAVSGYVAEKLRGVVEAKSLNVVPNLIDIDATRKLAEDASGDSHSNSSGAQPAEPYLLFIGKLNELKGANLLPEIMRRAQVPPGMPLVVVGDGPLSQRLAREANIQVRGWLSNQDTLRLLSRARVLLFPSQWAEPLSRVLLEAQALGTPTIALNTGGTRDIIEHEVNGLLARDVEDFAAHLTRVLRDSSLHQRLSSGAAQVAAQKFDSGAIVEQVEAIYQRALSHSTFTALEPHGPQREPTAVYSESPGL